jgi:hypothetical protein
MAGVAGAFNRSTGGNVHPRRESVNDGRLASDPPDAHRWDEVVGMIEGKVVRFIRLAQLPCPSSARRRTVNVSPACPRKTNEPGRIP